MSHSTDDRTDDSDPARDPEHELALDERGDRMVPSDRPASAAFRSTPLCGDAECSRNTRACRAPRCTPRSPVAPVRDRRHRSWRAPRVGFPGGAENHVLPARRPYDPRGGARGSCGPAAAVPEPPLDLAGERVKRQAHRFVEGSLATEIVVLDLDRVRSFICIENRERVTRILRALSITHAVQRNAHATCALTPDHPPVHRAKLSFQESRQHG
jgi:hypothetical protein